MDEYKLRSAAWYLQTSKLLALALNSALDMGQGWCLESCRYIC